MRTVLTLPHRHDTSLPPWANADADLRLPRVLAERVIAERSPPDGAVLDPFAGFGTTLVAAEQLDRDGYGIEYEPRRAAYVRERLTEPDRIVTGDAFDVSLDRFPAIDLLFTSPPYMIEGTDADPLANYDGETDYDTYLRETASLFERLKGTLTADANVVVEVSNMNWFGNVTTLAWDVGNALSDVFEFRGEVIVNWENDANAATGVRSDDDANGTYAYGYDHSYLLTFDVSES